MVREPWRKMSVMRKFRDGDYERPLPFLFIFSLGNRTNRMSWVHAKINVQTNLSFLPSADRCLLPSGRRRRDCHCTVLDNPPYAYPLRIALPRTTPTGHNMERRRIFPALSVHKD